MFDNLLYIFSKENEIINNYITDTESIREVKKLKQELIKKDAEIKLLQRRYNKLLNNCIQIELNKKVKSEQSKNVQTNNLEFVTDIPPEVPQVPEVSDISDASDNSIEEYVQI
jgi:hypothetical protein